MHLCIVLRLLLQIPLITCLVQQFDTFFLEQPVCLGADASAYVGARVFVSTMMCFRNGACVF